MYITSKVLNSMSLEELRKVQKYLKRNVLQEEMMLDDVSVEIFNREFVIRRQLALLKKGKKND